MSILTLALTAVATAAPAAQAQQAPSSGGEADIVVTAERLSGSVISDVPPVVELGEAAIESYGVSSIADLLTAIAPQTGSGRGRGGGGPVVLLNGQRISGFAEIRDLPPEAIKRVQILPEQVALQYGFAADQRVVNFILKDNFRAVTAEVDYGQATQNARREVEVEGTAAMIDKGSRMTLRGEYADRSRVLESDRDIVQRGTLFPFDDLGLYRTLLPASDTVRLNGVYSRPLADGVSASFNANWQRDTNQALLGVPSTNINAANGQAITRGFLPSLARTAKTDTVGAGLTVNGAFSGWTWTLTGNAGRTTTTTFTDRGVDVLALQAAILAPGSTTNPLSASFTGPVPMLSRDTARSQTDTSSVIYTVSGSPLELPAGQVRTTLRAGFATTRLNGQSVRSSIATASRLAREEANGRINVDIPLANAARDVAAPLGRLSINGNLAYRKLSDFGGLLSFGYGVNWQPVEGLTLLASMIGSENEPGIGDLGNPVIVTPGVPTFDFTRGETVLANRISGGNPELLTEVQRDVKASMNYEPGWLKGLTLSVDYFRNRSRNPVANFPVLTPDIEAAFPGRVTRDATGRLLSIDGRSVNFASTASDVLRVGFTFQKSWGQQGRGPMGMMGGGRGPGGGGGGGGPRGPGGGGGFGGNNIEGGRWTLALYDSIRFRDEIAIRPGLPKLNLLGGDATGNNGGAARHSLDLDAGYFNKGFGVRLTGSYQSATTVVGSNAASTLRFGDLATFNLNTFYNFDAAKKLVEDVPFLKGARMRLGITNVFDRIRDVRDGTGLVPLGYQPGYLDARGRFIEIDFRKRF